MESGGLGIFAMSEERIGRREVLWRTALASALGHGLARGESPPPPPTRVITKGPRHHWFGYYDKLQFDRSGRYVLGMQVAFEHRSPRADDVIGIGMVDLQDGDRWIDLGESRAWCWQQGCMLQWVPESRTEVIWNDRQDGRFVSHILDVETRVKRTLPHPVYALSPDGRSAITCDFRRIADVRPGYGYNGLPDPYAEELAPAGSGVSHVDLQTGRSRMVLSLADMARRGPIPNSQLGVKHYFNHLLFSPGGSRFIALHRWRYPNGRRLTRLVTARPDGSDLRIVIPNGYASHFIWRDEEHILAQSREWLGESKWNNFLFEDREGGRVEAVGHGVLDPAGHLSYLPGGEWILNDTYPQGPKRMQTPHLFHVGSGRRINLGAFHLPALYTGEWRVDTHPRCSRDSRYVCIDAPAGDQGRQLHLIDIRDQIR